MSGQLVHDEQIKVQQVNTSSFAKGVYSIDLITEKGKTTQRFAKD
jgi:hypothetical protein